MFIPRSTFVLGVLLSAASLAAAQSSSQTASVSGRVLMADGSVPPEPVAIERTCNNSTHREGFADLNGEFTVVIGQGQDLQDVSENNFGNVVGASGNKKTGFGPGTASAGSDIALMGCDIHAVLDGYRSTTVVLRPSGQFTQVKAGIIILEALRPAYGKDLSITSSDAPKDAKRSYERAQKALQQGKQDVAEKELTAAVAAFPKYADAWFLLGNLHGDQNKFDVAAKDFQQAIAADEHFVKPHYGLALAALRLGDWKQVEQSTATVSKITPASFTDAYYYNAVANLSLGNNDAAEKSARTFVELDEKQGRHPDVLLIIGQLLFLKQDYAGALAQQKAFLAAAPKAPPAQIASVKENVEKLEAMLAASPK